MSHQFPYELSLQLTITKPLISGNLIYFARKTCQECFDSASSLMNYGRKKDKKVQVNRARPASVAFDLKYHLAAELGRTQKYIKSRSSSGYVPAAVAGGSPGVLKSTTGYVCAGSVVRRLY